MWKPKTLYQMQPKYKGKQKNITNYYRRTRVCDQAEWYTMATGILEGELL